MRQRKLWPFLVLLITAASLTMIGEVCASSTKTVTDLSGQRVQIPTKVKRVADLWHANNQVVLLLGGQQKIVATTPIIQKMPWFATVYPPIKKVAAPYNGNDLQVEELVKQKPDVVLTADTATAQKAKAAHLPALNIMYQNFAGLRKSVTVTAQVLGGSAPKIAQTYNQELTNNLNDVKQQLAHTKTRPKVLHVVSTSDLLKVDGTKTIVNQWIQAAGGENAIAQAGNMISVTPEQLIKSNPDVIIVGQTTSKQALQAFKKDPRLSQLKAVKTKKVYGNPQGTFYWDRYSAEEALQVLWAAKLLHPQQFKALNMTSKTRNFYQKYYHYQLTNTQVNQILAGATPAKN